MNNTSPAILTHPACPTVLYSSHPGTFELTALSPSIAGMFGYHDHELLEKPSHWLSLIHPDDRLHVLAKLSQGALDTKQECEYRFLHKQLGYRWIQNIFQLTLNTSGLGLELVGCWLDRTDQQQQQLALKQRDHLLVSIAQASQHLLTHADCNTAMTKALAVVGSAAQVDRLYICEIHEVIPDQASIPHLRYAWVQKTEATSTMPLPWPGQSAALGQQRWYQVLTQRLPFAQSIEDFVEPERSHVLQAGLRSVLLLPLVVEDRFWGFMGFENRQVEQHWLAADIQILQTFAASLCGALQHHQKESQLLHHAFHDPLTNLPNRALFLNRLEQSLSQIQRYPDYLFAVLFLDLDRFKIINDNMGHGIGDRLLKGIAERLLGSLRPGDTASRLGGDEFVVLLNGIQSLQDASIAADRLQQQLRLPFQFDTHDIFIDVSIGITLSNFGYQYAEQVMRDADVAMYQAKSAGKGCHKVFNTTMPTQTITRSQLVIDIQRAIEQQTFEIYYQPIVCLKTGEITAFETILRWYDSNQQPISPKDLIEMAEEAGKSEDLGLSVLHRACDQLQQWQQIPQRQSLDMHVNLSAKQLCHDNLAGKIADILKSRNIAPTHLKLELAENTRLRNNETTLALISPLRGLGIDLVLDEFGAGYSSLSHLYHLPIRALKIDRSFIQRLDLGEEGQAIIRSILLLANNLNVKVIAEGVKNRTQLNYLNSLNCTHGQGFLFAPPLTAPGATSLLRSQDSFECQSA